MVKRILALITLSCFTVCVTGGCYSRHLIQKEELDQYPKYKIAKVITIDGDTVKYSTARRKAAVVVEDRIEGFLKDSTLKTIPLSQVDKIYVRKLKTRQTVLVAAGVSVLTLAGLTLLCAAASGGLGASPY